MASSVDSNRPSPSVPPPATPSTATATEPKPTITIGSRKSALALIQTEIVRSALQAAHPEYEYVVEAMSTAGDKNQVTALHDFGAKSLWTYELEALLLSGQVDLIVHSLKDIPTQLPPSLTIAAILARADARDALVVRAGQAWATIDALPAGSVVGTSSVRRSAQLARRHPHLRFANVRGNVGTRLAKLDAADGPYACLVLAAAGLVRLDLAHRITQYLDSHTAGVLHAVGQGALAIETREHDDRVRALVAALAHGPTARACLAERSLLRALEGGCSVPIGVESRWAPDGALAMRAAVVSLDGTQAVEALREAPVANEEQADAFGRAMAALLVERGAGPILQKITLNRALVDA
ncbi:MAG: porphobilinogen deaminase [Phylliscum demangeonii]|nr:MAG: porphobilinogen deaminase [Phylliscum demangeonii]